MAIAFACAGCVDSSGSGTGEDDTGTQGSTPTLWFEPHYSGTMYIGSSYGLGYNMNFGSLSNVEYTIISNDAAATIDKSHNITAAKPGTVRIRVSGTYEGTKLSTEGILTFEAPKICFIMDSTTIKVGDSVHLKYMIDPMGSTEMNIKYLTCEILSGNALVTVTEDRYYIVGKEAGEVQVKLTYKNEERNVELTCTETLTFTARDFNISTDKNEIFVGYDIGLSATASDIDKFDASKVTYVLESGTASITGNVLKATAEGTVKVYATYDYNGIAIKSNTLTLQLAYDGNVILKPEDLLKLNGSDATFNLLNDIDLSSYKDWEPITGFKGHLNGNGYKITGLKITVDNLEENKGLFDILSGTVENLTLEGTVTSFGEAKNIGLLCGQNNGTVTNVTVSGTINTEYCSYVGGIAGISGNSGITGCTSNVDIAAKDYVGGIAGTLSANRSASSINRDNTNNGTVNGSSYVGGIYGSLSVQDGRNNDTITLTGHVNNGSVNGSGSNIGGLFGNVSGRHSYISYTNYYAKIKITGCANNADVSGTDNVGGIAGNASTQVGEITLSTNAGAISGNMYVGGYAGKADGATMRSLTNAIVVTGKAYVGGIAGYAGKVDGCVNNGKILLEGYYTDTNGTSYSYAGGIAGFATGAVDCVNNTQLDAEYGGRYVGGIVGYLNASRSASETISGNENHGAINGTSYVGGIFGYLTLQDGSNNDIIIVNNNKNDGAVTATESRVGGIAGHASGKHSYISYTNYYAKVKFTSCENKAAVSGVDYVGGIVGYAPEYVSEISLCKNEDSITGNMYVGSFAGYAGGTTLRSLENRQVITGKAYLGGIAGYAGKLESCVNKGTIVAEGYYLDSGSNLLSYVGGIAGFATGAVKCSNEAAIDVSGGGNYVGGIVAYLNASRSSSETVNGNTNSGEIKGTNYVGGIFGCVVLQDGSNNDTVTISNNTNSGMVYGSENYVSGIIGYVRGDHSYISYTNYYARIKITECKNNASVTGADYVGGIVGYAPEYVSEISSCRNLDAISGNMYVGGYAGYASGTTMRSLENRHDITGKAYLGGIAGYAGKLESCVNKGTVKATGYHLSSDSTSLSYVGGVAGFATGAVKCSNEASLDVSGGGRYVGGVVAYLHATRSASETINGNSNSGEIKGTDYVGGIFGCIVLQESSNNDTITISNNTNSGMVTGSKNCVGGIVGYVRGNHCYISYTNYYSSMKLSECKNSASVTGVDYVGGIVGYAPEYVSEISLCQNLDDITGNLYVGGYVGRADGTTLRSLKNSYGVTGKVYVGGIAGYAGKLEYCEFSGKLTVTGYELNSNLEKISYAGGLAGYASGALGCTNTSDIIVSDGGRYVGGLIGYLCASRSASNLINDNKNGGAVLGTDYVGGLFGYMTIQTGSNSDTLEVKNNVNSGAVNATGNYVGGILGYVCGNHCYISYTNYYSYVRITSCQNNGDVSGADYVCGIAGAIGSYINTEEAVWGLNIVTGTVTAVGTNTAEKYLAA